MTATRWLWAVFTVAAAFAQTIRNAMQHELTAALGTAGATQVRFLFGFPFALVFLAILVAKTGAPLPRPGLMFWARVLAGAFTQILATALMLAAMGERSFVVTIAFIKTKPIQVALFGFIFLGDKVTPPMIAAILVATAGVIVMSTKPGGKVGGIRPTLLGLASGGALALAAIGFRGDVRDYALRNRRYSRVLWARSPRNSGFLPSRWRPRRACERWHWWKFYSRSSSRVMALANARRRARQ